MSVVKRLLRRVGRVMLSGAGLPHWEDPRTSCAAKASLIGHAARLQSLARAGAPLPRLEDCGLRVFSQFEEDGYLLYLAAVLEIAPKLFVDVGSADGINSNCANLALNLGWHGLFIDGDSRNIEKGRQFYTTHPDSSLYPPDFRQCMVTRENINQVIAEAGFRGQIGILSIDIDGNDYHVWDALETVVPIVVVIETHTEFGEKSIVVPYDAAYVYPGRHPDYHGASPVAMVKLARKKGYRLVGANRFGFNLIFAKNGVFEDRVPEVALESVLKHPRYAERLALFEAVKDFPYVTVDH